MTTTNRIPRKLRKGEIIRRTDFINAKSNQGKQVWKEWTANLPEQSAGWLPADNFTGSKVSHSDLLVFARL